VSEAPRSPHRAWVEVDHAAIRANLAVLRERAGADKQVIAVVKADAYGHGALEVARTLVRDGVERLAVATVGEALELRQDGVELPILVLWAIGAPEAASTIDNELETIVYDRRTVELLEAAAAERGRRASVQLKVDTGLGRQGALPDEALELASRVSRSRHLRLAGTFSHLAAAGEDDAYTDAMRSAGIDPGLVHLCATGGILAGSGSYADAVRPGIGLYGMVPGWAADRDHGLRPALSLKAVPLRIFDLPAGSAISYGLRFRASRATRIATLGIGYGDGWPRIHTNNGVALVRGRRVPVVGTISMDGITVDVGDIDDVTYDDVFVLIGEQDGARVSADEVAAERRTINYEVTTALRRRLPRLHLGA
jgi:alanine racemase